MKRAIALAMVAAICCSPMLGCSKSPATSSNLLFPVGTAQTADRSAGNGAQTTAQPAANEEAFYPTRAM
jgi:hypothetical protein